MSTDTPDWQPPRPSRPEVAAVMEQIFAALRANHVEFEAEQDDTESPDFWAIIAHDDTGHANLGFIGWAEDVGRVAFAAYDPIRGAHDEAEGVDEDASRCFWLPDCTHTMILHLDGTVRAMAAEERAERLARLAVEHGARP